MNYTDLPALNAILNLISTLFLTVGYVFIRRGRPIAHRNCMVAALASSVLFLASYVTYHVTMQRIHGSAHTRFVDPAWFRPFYLVILVTHLIGAMVIVPLVLMTVSRAFREKFEAHKRIARWTWPVWMYVSITGVIIYLLLYRIFPQR